MRDARVRDGAKRNRVSALRKAEKGRMPACEMERSGIEHSAAQEQKDCREYRLCPDFSDVKE